MKQIKTAGLFALLISTWMFSGCGGTGAATTNIAGNVSGLFEDTSVGLQNNGKASITVSANGNFHFDGQVQAGTPYAVTVSSNPLGQTCQVTNGTGIVGQYSGDVSNIAVACIPVPGDLFGVVTGLSAGATVVLQNLDTTSFVSNTLELVTLKANGPFIFPSMVQGDFTYNVVVSQQPAGQTCTITKGAGVMPVKGGNVAIQVLCQ